MTIGSTTVLTNGILPYAVWNGVDFATHNTGVVGGYASYAADDYASSANNVNVTVAAPAPATFGVNSLAFRTAQASSFALTGANTTGAILVGSNVGANATLIAGATSGDTLQGTVGGELIVQQYNTDPAGALTISAGIVNNGTATALVKAGPAR
ncbi:MAG: hypothetical protein QM811_18095 [Pirellulales bacterium]